MRIMYFLSQQTQSNFSKVILNVAEKNKAAKAIAYYLSQDQVKERYVRSKYNNVYEFNYAFNNTLTNMVMTSVLGHLTKHHFSNEFTKWRDMDLINLFDDKLTKVCIKSLYPVKETLEDLVKSCDSLIIWTDCDREGESIGMEIATICLNVKPDLVVKRAQFSEITSSSINHAIMNLVDIDVNLCWAVEVRQHFDLKTGAAFTRLQTLYLSTQFPKVLAKKIISYGSCQFPTLGFVVERYNKIKKFISEPFWKICLTHVKDSKTAIFNWDQNRSFDKNLVSSIYSKINAGGTLACVIDVNSALKTKLRPLAMDTIEMEKLASRRLGISPTTTMKIAENLYIQGFITYPRTETNIFSTQIDLAHLVKIQISDHRWGDFAKQLLSQRIDPHNGKKSDKAHPPICPLKLDTALVGDEANIFELITRHFLACLSKDAIGHETKVVVDCVSKSSGFNNWSEAETGKRRPSGLGEVFSLSGSSVVEKNYLDIYSYEKWFDREIPIYKVGELLENHSVKMHEGHTAPPPLLTDADLITLMDKHGIGTDSTHANHIDRVKKREYVKDVGPKKNYLIPDSLGLGLVEGYDMIGINMSYPDHRSRFEADLNLICEGKKNPQDVLNFHLNEYRTLFLETTSKIDKLKDGVAKYLSNSKTKSTNSKKLGPIAVPDSIDNPNCHCDIPAEIHKVVDGVDKGKSFYTCSLNSCTMFRLVEQAEPDIQSAPVIPSDVIWTEDNSAVRKKLPFVACHCKKAAVLLTVRKENENKGRTFYACTQPIRCSFFQWADEPISSKKSTPQSKQNVEPSSSFNMKLKVSSDTVMMWPQTAHQSKSDNDKQKVARRCSICKQPGHTAKTCSSRGL